LAAAGVVATLMQLGGITLPVLLDYSVPFRMEFYGMPLGVVYLVLALWLLIRGLNESTESPQRIEHEVESGR
jgi:hypothetical protein